MLRVGPDSFRRPGWAGRAWRDWRDPYDRAVAWRMCPWCLGARVIYEHVSTGLAQVACDRCLGIGEVLT